MDQSVMVFSSSATRAAALTAPVEGMLTWLQDTNKYENYNGTAWVALGSSPILQVLSTTKTDVFTMTSTTCANVTGLAVSITPSSATSKILIAGSVNVSSTSGTNGVHFRLARGATAIAIGDTAGTRNRTYSGGNTIAASMVSSAFNFLDVNDMTSVNRINEDSSH
jgi:hypothetical protein